MIEVNALILKNDIQNYFGIEGVLNMSTTHTKNSNA